jgi:predicted nucleic acid-binding protein
MYLIDTSVWIDFFRDSDTPAVQKLSHILDNQIPFAITSTIFQELLQGAKTQKDFDKLSNDFATQRFLHPKDPVHTYTSAAQIYFDGQQSGIALSSTIDCLIAQIAMEHEAILLHSDRDYEAIRKIKPELILA